MSSRSKFSVLILLMGCRTSWDACETTVDGQAACVENGSDYQVHEFDWCGGGHAAGTPSSGTCADLGYGCAASDSADGLFFADDTCE